jgi:hypothetical protein
MKRTTHILIAMTVLMVLFASACGLPSAAPVDQAQPAANNGAAQPAQPAQNFAPACQNATACAAPAVADTEGVNTFCVKKVPYQNILLEPGTIFESLDTSGELNCQDSRTVVGGKNVITCTGKELWTYQLKLTNTACGGAALATGTGQCADGQGYDAANNCCAPISVDGGGSTIINVNIGACPTR